MSLKKKITFTLSVSFSVLVGIVMIIIYILFNDFRSSEFKERFVQRLNFTSAFIEKSENFDQEAPVFFRENSDNVLLNEKILIYNDKKQLIYPIKKQKTKNNTHFLRELDKTKTVFNEKLLPEIYAAKRNINGKNYYILTSAYDSYGKSKLNYLKYLLITAYVISTLLTAFFIYYFMEKFLRPLERLNEEISEITAHKLTTQIPVHNSKDEISILAQSFNTMIMRLNDIFQSQKDFTSSASHEIRTPITRMAFQVENLIKLENHSPTTLSALQQMLTDVYLLSDLTNSLLILTKFDKENIQSIYEEIRIDEVIFESFEGIKKSFPELKMDFNISENSMEDALLSIKGVHSLLKIVFINLLKNAASYSDSHKADILLTESPKEIIVEVISFGPTISEKEQSRLFDAFTRGNNAQNIPGSGLGLRIVKRILEYHDAQIQYVSQKNTNIFRIKFLK